MSKSLTFIVAVLLFILSVVIPLEALAEAPAYKLVKEKSALKFFAIQNNAPVEGRFDDFTTDIHFDPEHLDQSSIKVEVNTGSVHVENQDVLTNIKLPVWLSTEAFPKATYVSKKITRMPSSDNYYVDGELTIRGKKVPATLNFRMEHFDSSNAVASGNISIMRKDFDVGQGEWSRDDVIKNEVRIEFRVATEKQ